MSREQSKWHCFLWDPSPTYSDTTKQCGLPHPGEYLRLHLLPHNRPAESKNMAQNKERIKAPKIKLSDEEEIGKPIRTEFKTLVIRMLTEMVEYGHKIEEEAKAMKREIKENIQGTNSEGKETEIQINNLEEKEEINIQPEQNEKQEFKKKKMGRG